MARVRRAVAERGRVVEADRPRLGLVCITRSDECRFRTITRSRYLALSSRERRRTLETLYSDNLARLLATFDFCAARDIRLYRATSALFPMSDEGLGARILGEMAADLSTVGERAARLGIRVLLHPDQFVVLNSDNPGVRRTSRLIMDKHARWFDLMGLAQSAWAPMILHGGKSGRGDELVEAIRDLPPPVRTRLVLENDEFAYSAREILSICRRAGVPMVFDCHHHVVKEKLDSYEHSSVAQFTHLARETWPDPAWQMVHVSNGRESFNDRGHSDFIHTMPSAYRDVPWIEVEAKAKEEAIEQLRRDWPPASWRAIRPNNPASSLGPARCAGEQRRRLPRRRGEFRPEDPDELPLGVRREAASPV